MNAPLILLSRKGAKPLPPVPTRDQVCGLNLHLQGLTVVTRQFGVQPWFEIAYQCCSDPADRAWVRQQKKAAGDYHQILEFFTNQQIIYNEPGVWLNTLVTPSAEQKQDWFRSLVLEVIQDGMIPVVAYDGDDGQAGAINALRQLPIVSSLLADLYQRILYARFWDGVFYGATPEQIAEFGRAFRAIHPDGHLAIEHQPGRLPAGDGGGDYEPGGRMSTYDTICHEFAGPDDSEWRTGGRTVDSQGRVGYNGSQIWQIAARVLGPSYRRPNDQPSDSDGGAPPYYLHAGNPRGQFFPCALEWAGQTSREASGAYFWSRGVSTKQQEDNSRAYFKGLGYRYTG